jgi:hypothetical protein
MHTHARALGLVILTLGAASVAQAGLLDPVSITRWAVASEPPNDLKQYGAGVAPFSATVTFGGGSATHNSTITADTVSMTGSASAHSAQDTSPSASSLLREQFVLASPTPYRFSAAWSISSDGALASLYARLTGPSGDIFFLDRDLGNATWTAGGYLQPGQYDYWVVGNALTSEGTGTHLPTIDFSATFSLTPEPATAVLLGLGAVGLLRRRRLR